uniref:Polygalacturonase n=1 Tax=Parastrongyloides trichosuri TaxID=131310 RepID=A0A0N4ZW50_PARTI
MNASGRPNTCKSNGIIQLAGYESGARVRNAIALSNVQIFIGLRWARVTLASWRGNGSPRRRCLGALRGESPTLVLRHGPDSYGRQ